MDLVFSLLTIIAKTIVKETVTALVKYVVSRQKEKIAPINGRDDGDTIE